jgi:hypothetical protein
MERASDNYSETDKSVESTVTVERQTNRCKNGLTETSPEAQERVETRTKKEREKLAKVRTQEQLDSCK